MFIAVLDIKFFIHGCRSLKEKRQRVGGLRDKFGSSKNIAVCESAELDSHDLCEISFVCTANDKKIIESRLSKIVDYCASSVDAELTDHQVTWI